MSLGQQLVDVINTHHGYDQTDDLIVGASDAAVAVLSVLIRHVEEDIDERRTKGWGSTSSCPH
jgi:hypothetical protein